MPVKLRPALETPRSLLARIADRVSSPTPIFWGVLAFCLLLTAHLATLFPGDAPGPRPAGFAEVRCCGSRADDGTPNAVTAIARDGTLTYGMPQITGSGTAGAPMTAGPGLSLSPVPQDVWVSGNYTGSVVQGLHDSRRDGELRTVHMVWDGGLRRWIVRDELSEDPRTP